MLNAISTITTKKIAIEQTLKEARRKLKFLTTKHQLYIKEDNNAGNEGQTKDMRQQQPK